MGNENKSWHGGFKETNWFIHYPNSCMNLAKSILTLHAPNDITAPNMTPTCSKTMSMTTTPRLPRGVSVVG